MTDYTNSDRRFEELEKQVRILSAQSMSQAVKIEKQEQQIQQLLSTTNLAKNLESLTELLISNMKTSEKIASELSEKVNATEKLARELTLETNILERKVENQACSIYQLIGGLFDPSQYHIREQHLSFLGEGSDADCPTCNAPNYPNECGCRDNSKWKQWPTTRQGNECETRIDAMEQTLMNIGKILLSSRPDEPQKTEYTVDESSVSSQGSSVNIRRMRNTCDLCGNE